MKKYLLPTLLIFGFCGFTVLSHAQKIITGTVTTDSIKALAGVTVEIQGTTVATLTDQEGRYTISAGDESILLFRLQGYISQEVPVNGRTQINVVLQRNKDSASAKSSHFIHINRQASHLNLNDLQTAFYLKPCLLVTVKPG